MITPQELSSSPVNAELVVHQFLAFCPVAWYYRAEPAFNDQHLPLGIYTH